LKNPILKILLLALLLFIVCNNLVFFPGNILSWDVFGYYLYLPFKFIYHDLRLHNMQTVHDIIDKYHSTGSFYQARPAEKGGMVMLYLMGMAIVYMPFFFAGHFVAGITGYAQDGFSLPYQYAIFAGCIFYSLAGIVALSKVLLEFFNERISAAVLVIIVIATNYIVHITMYGQNAYTHNFLFTAYAFILLLTIRWHKSHKIKHLVPLAFLCGLAILSRPSEIVCLIIPLFWGVADIESLKEKAILLKKHWLQISVFILIVLFLGSLQLCYWKIMTGKFFFNSYGGNAGEGMDLNSPNTLKVLFSFRKGWLIYTPVMIFAIAGFPILYKYKRTAFTPLFLYFIFNLYIVSCWTNWWYAQSFSQRALVPSYPVMAVALGFLLQWLASCRFFFRAFVYFLMGLCMVLNIFQTVQFHRGIIDGDRMTRKYYFATFGKLHVSEEEKKLLLINRSFNGREKFTNENEYLSNVIAAKDFEDEPGHTGEKAHAGRYSFKTDSINIYSPAIEIPHWEITGKDHAWIRVKAYIYPVTAPAKSDFGLVVQYTHNGYAYKYTVYDAAEMNLETGKWNEISFDYLTPEVRKKSDTLKTYFWLRGRNGFYIDDMQVEAFEKKY
jgi:hypothetical protein